MDRYIDEWRDRSFIHSFLGRLLLLHHFISDAVVFRRGWIEFPVQERTNFPVDGRRQKKHTCSNNNTMNENKRKCYEQEGMNAWRNGRWWHDWTIGYMVGKMIGWINESLLEDGWLEWLVGWAKEKKGVKQTSQSPPGFRLRHRHRHHRLHCLPEDWWETQRRKGFRRSSSWPSARTEFRLRARDHGWPDSGVTSSGRGLRQL